MLKQQKGITLVALVITIVVLIILAGVAISLTLSDSGIFQRARQGANMYGQAQANETGMVQGLDKTVNDLVSANE